LYRGREEGNLTAGELGQLLPLLFRNGHVKPVALTRLLFNRADIRVMGVGGRAYAKDCPAVLFIIKVCYCPI
jgi:hypothetical protein